MKLRKNAKLKVFKKGDFILLLILLAAIITAAVFAFNKGASQIEIYVDGKIVMYHDLNVDGEFDLLDGKMTVAVKNRQVYVKHSDCAEQLCVLSAPISSGGGMIVCLPNKVVIKLTAKEVDAIT